jgi:hypothetical protein
LRTRYLENAIFADENDIRAFPQEAQVGLVRKTSPQDIFDVLQGNVVNIHSFHLPRPDAGGFAPPCAGSYGSNMTRA